MRYQWLPWKMIPMVAMGEHLPLYGPPLSPDCSVSLPRRLALKAVRCVVRWSDE